MNEKVLAHWEDAAPKTNNYLHNDYIIVIRHPDDGHWSGRNMLVENNM